MKRLLTLLLTLALLLTACHPVMPIDGPGQEQSQSSEAGSGDQAEESQVDDQGEEGPSLMEARQPIGEEGSVYYVPCPQLEEVPWATPYVAGDTLLLSTVTYDDMGENGTLQLTAIDQKTGETVGEYVHSTPNYIAMQILDEHICLADAIAGWVRIFDHQLTLEKEYSIRPDDGSWYLSSDLQKLYSISWDGGICCIDLTTLSEEPVLESVTDMIPTQVDTERIMVAYTDMLSQVHRCQILSLATGTLEDLPLSGQYYQVMQAEGIWLYNHPFEWQSYMVQSGGQTRQLSLEDGYLQLLEGGHLLRENDAGGELKLYDRNGGFVSGYTRENLLGYVNSHWAWSEYYNGYFFAETQDAGSMRLLFMDLNQQQIGAPLALRPYETETKAEGSIVSAELYDRANRLSEQYDVDIRIAEQCELEYIDFTANMLTEEYSIDFALDCLENALAVYPAGFFTQLKCGSITSIRIEIVHDLKDKNAKEEDAFSEFNGFSREMSDHRLMVLDAETMYLETIYHEFAHMIDSRMDFDSRYRNDALFSEEAWLALQPEGYEFPYSYTELPDSAYEATDLGYFARIYGATYPGEDRATLMELAMLGYTERIHESPVLMEKLTFYSDCIRDCFDTTTWPAITQWETALYN